jgi:hypothetical protein
MANSQASNAVHYEYATVDTAPTPAGYWTNAVTPRKSKITKLFFSIRETTDDSSPSVMTVKLQFKCPGDTGWQDYLDAGSDWAIGTRIIINEFAEGVQWRAGVADFSAFTSGALTFGFDW